MVAGNYCRTDERRLSRYGVATGRVEGATSEERTHGVGTGTKGEFLVDAVRTVDSGEELAVDKYRSAVPGEAQVRVVPIDGDPAIGITNLCGAGNGRGVNGDRTAGGVVANLIGERTDGVGGRADQCSRGEVGRCAINGCNETVICEDAGAIPHLVVPIEDYLVANQHRGARRRRQWTINGAAVSGQR